MKKFITLLFVVFSFAAHAQTLPTANMPRYTVPGVGDVLQTQAAGGGVGYQIIVIRQNGPVWTAITQGDGFAGALALQAAINSSGGMTNFLRGQYNTFINPALAVIYPSSGGGSGPPPTGDASVDALNSAIAAGVTGGQVNGSPSFIVH